MHNVPAVAILDLATLITSGGCGSGAGRPDVPPPDAPSARGPAPVGPGPLSAPVMDANAHLPTDSKPNPPVMNLVRAPAVATGNPELDPLVSYLKASFADPIQAGRRLVITLDTGVRLLDPGQDDYQKFVDRLLAGSAGQVPAELIRDFGEKNRGPSVIWPELTTHLPATLLTPDEHDALFTGPGGGWGRFYAKYPDAYGIIHVSRVGLNRDNTLALFYVGVGQQMLLGHGRNHVLRKEGDVWVELPIRIGSEWIARTPTKDPRTSIRVATGPRTIRNPRGRRVETARPARIE